MMPFNSPVVLISFVVALANLWIYRGNLGPTFRTYAIAVAAGTMLLFVTTENLRRPVAPSINIEPVGVFIFVMTLGYSVVAHAFRQEAVSTMSVTWALGRPAEVRKVVKS